MIIYNFVKNLILHRKYTKVLNKVYKDENLLNNLSQLFGVQFKMDWIGRIYAIINPNIVNGEFDKTTQIYEYGENGLDNSIYVEQKIMEKLNVAAQFIQANNLFDLLTYRIERVDDYDNYLFVIQPITLEEALNSTKKFSILMSIVILTTIICTNLINF